VLPKIKNIIVASIDGDAEDKEFIESKMPGMLRMEDLIEKYEPKPPEVTIDPLEDLAYVVFTGGATGKPKGVMLTHRNRMANIMQGIPWMMASLAPGIIGKSSVEIPLPLFHSYGQWVMQTAIYWGLKAILIRDPRDTDSIVNLMIENRPFFTSLVPTQLMRMREYDIPRMPVMLMSGAAPLPRQLRDDVSEKLQMPISEGYGLTETGPVTHLDLSGFSKITGFLSEQKYSIGVPVPDTEVRIVDIDVGKECASNEIGHMYIRGPQVMKGYWPIPGSGLEDGWLPTGDIARMDEDGYFYIVDRVKDMANVSGYKVYTTAVDEVLFKHPAIAMAVAIGIPDPERPGSERIAAFLKLKKDYEGKVSADEIIQFCKKELPPYAVPKVVEFRDNIPFTITEKLYKRKLREEFLKTVETT
jgi:long-chain acyl-CoA synthetase